MSLRTLNTGINWYDNSCWFASALQALVDCPALIEYLFRLENEHIGAIYRSKKGVFTYFLEKIITLRNEEIEIYGRYIHKFRNYKNDIYEHAGASAPTQKPVSKRYVRHYPSEETNLTVAEAKKEWYVTETNIEMFLQLRELPLERWLGILERSQAPLEILIKREMIGWTFEELLYYAKIFKPLFKEINDDGVPLLWGDPDFNNLLKSYLYALIFNMDPNKNLNPKPLRKYMFESMTNSVNIIDANVKENFIDEVLQSASNPLRFFSIIFSNFESTTIGWEGFPFTPGSFLDRAAIRLPYGIKSFKNLNAMVNDPDCLMAKNAHEFNFLIINNPLIDTKGGAQGEGFHDFITDEIITLKGRDYRLCSVIVHKGGAHYVSLSPRGCFDDSTIREGPNELKEFCKTSGIQDVTLAGIKKHPGYLWFYELDYEMVPDTRIEGIKRGIQGSFGDYERMVPYEFYLEEKKLKPKDTVELAIDVHPAWNKDNLTVLLAIPLNEVQQQNLVLHPDHSYWKEVKQKNPDFSQFFNPLKAATAADLAQTPLTEQPRPSAEPKPSAEPRPSAEPTKPKSWPVEMPDPISTGTRNLSKPPPGKKDFNFTEDDKVLIPIPEREFSVYKYFNRFTIGDINNYFGTEFSKCAPQKNAFECLSSQKLNYKSFVGNNEKFKSLLTAAPDNSGAEARPVETPSSQSSSSPDNLNQSQKQKIIKLIPNIESLYTNFMTTDVNKDTFTNFLIRNNDSIGNNVDTVMNIYTSGGYSNYKKYLKYKNKYLQLKRFEK